MCDFALSWLVIEGHAGAIDLDGLAVVMVGTYSDDEPGSPWRVALYVDERGTKEQRDVLATIFLGRAGGTVLRNFAAAIQGVYAIRPARIEIEHVAGRERFRVPDRVEVIAAGPVATNVAVTCAIPGHDRAGHEVIAEVMRVEEAPLSWEVRGRCSYAAAFDYVGDAPTTPLMDRLPAMGMSKSPSLDRQGEARGGQHRRDTPTPRSRSALRTCSST